MYDLVNFGYNPWSHYWKRNQSFFYALSQQPFVDKSFFINTPVFIGDLVRAPKQQFSQPRINNWRGVFPYMSSGLKVISPVHFPLTSRFPRIGRFGEERLRKQSEFESTSRRIVIANQVGSINKHWIEPFWDSASLKVFDWSDDFRAFVNDPLIKGDVDQTVDYFIRTADLVTTINDDLARRASRLNGNVVNIANGTSYFARQDNADMCPLDSLEGMSGQIVGYVGWLNSLRIDQALVQELLEKRPDVTFVFMGPSSEPKPLGDLPSRYSNLKVLGPVPYDRLYKVYEYFSACILPNNINEHTNGNDPIKLYDYLASGKPVISTATAGSEKVVSCVSVVGTASEFLEKLDSVLIGPEEGREQRIALAGKHCISNRAGDFIASVKKGLNID